MDTVEQCPRCGVGRLKSWYELSEEERQVVRRLPAENYSFEVRRNTHQWCTQCWHESGPAISNA
jgi:hypothetical protein